MRSSCRRLVSVILVLIMAAVMAGCNGTSTNSHPVPPPNNPTPQPQPATFPAFDLQGSPPVVPFPNSIPGILVNPATGKNAVPGQGEPFDSINSLSGYSTSGNLMIPFDGPVKPSSVTNDTIKMFDTANNTQAQLAFQVVNDASGNSTVIATPILPLQQDSTYVVVITSGVIGANNGLPVLSSNTISLVKQATPLVDGAGHSTVYGVTDAQAQALEPVRQAMQPGWAAAEAATGLSRTDIPFAYIYKTEPLYTTLQGLVAKASTDAPQGGGPVYDPSFNPLAISSDHGNNTVSPAPLDITPSGSQPYSPGPIPGSVQYVFAAFEEAANIPVGTLLNAAGDPNQTNTALNAIYVGSLPIPRYLPIPPTSGASPQAIEASLNGYFSDPPVATETLNVPFLCFMPAHPVGVVLYQHGITVNKTTAFFIAESNAEAGLATICIDLPDHGFFNPGVDVVNNTTGATGPDGKIDGDGAHYINLASLRRTRDNQRQAVVDLAYVAAMVAQGHTNIPGMPTVAPLFLGHSLGSIVGGVFIALDPYVSRAVLNVGGGRLTALILNSQEFGPRITAGLEAEGIQPGTPQFLQFFIMAQAVVDDGDPINYARHWIPGDLSESPTQVLMQEAIGDTVVPNSATEDLASSSVADGQGINALSPLTNPIPLLGAPLSLPTAAGVSGIFQFVTDASHSALLTGPADIATAMRTQLLGFFLTGHVPYVTPRLARGVSPTSPLQIHPTVYFGK